MMGHIFHLRIIIAVALLIFHVMINAKIVTGEAGTNLEQPKSNTSSVDETATGNSNYNETSGTSMACCNDLILANAALQNRIETLEKLLANVEVRLTSLMTDVQFHHPTSEVQYVDMEVVHWDEAVKNNLRNVGIPFQAGFVTGAFSSWEFSLARENNAVTVNLLLVEDRYNRRALFAGFTAYILNTEGNVYSQANALPVNFLDGNGRNLHLPNVISLDEISNSSNGLLSDDYAFSMRFRLELLAVGHKLYSDNSANPQQPTKDVQTVLFDVENLLEKLEERKQNRSNASLQPIAYTKFILTHDSWNIDTSWSAEILENDNNAESIAFHVILERCEWPKLFASFHVEVWNTENRTLIHKQVTPVNDFMKDKMELSIPNESNNIPKMLQFKLQFIVYGEYARYYSDVI